MARSLRKNFLLNTAYQILQAVTPLLTTPYLARMLGSSQNGVFSYTQSITNYFVLFATLGMSVYGVRAVALCGDDRKKRSRVFCAAFASQLLAGTVVLLAYLAYIVVIHEGGIFISLIWGLWVLYAVFDVSWLLFGCEEFKIPTIRSFATKLAMVAAVFLFVHDEGDLWAYVLAVAGSYFANAALVWPFVGRYVDFTRPRLNEVLGHLRANARLFVPVIAVSIYTTLDKIMLGALSTSDEVAFFDYAEKIARLPLHVVTAMGTVMLPRMSGLLELGRRGEGLTLLSRCLWVMLATAIAFGFGIVAVAPEFVPLFFGEGYDACVPLMAVLAVIIPVISATNVIGKQYLLPSSRDRDYTASLLIGAAVNLAFNAASIPRLGGMGAAVGTVLAEASILASQSFMVRRELPLASYALSAVPFVCIGLVMYAAVRAAAPIVAEAVSSSVAVLFLEVALGAAVYLALSLVWCLASGNGHFKSLFGGHLPSAR